jgi:hypothetical protein
VPPPATPPPVEPPVPPPDDKDWTWVTARSCPECGFDPLGVQPAALPDRLLRAAAPWPAVLARPDADRRPSPDVWSPLEYAAHVRDVHVLFARRATLLLEQDDPLFENWDQDVTARREAYWAQDPAVVARELTGAAADAAGVYAGVAAGAWSRSGRRSNGSVFTVATLGTYHLHDVEHHLHDVGVRA